MATLVQFLVSGVNGASNGTATFLLRGTASSAAAVLYTDFEMSAQPGTNIISLDSNGAAEIYTNAYVDCVIKNSGGTTLRTVTVGDSATNLEVISDSFTGTDYSGSPTAVNEPITLAAILNKWDDSAGADDWKVSVGGVATNLSSAFAALAGLFFNVKDPAYGAVGDGTTDDTTAIGLAISAAVTAGGGVVYFPATTTSYRVSTLTISGANIHLMGAGSSASKISSNSTSGAIVSLTDNTNQAIKKITGLGFVCTGSNSNPVISIENTQIVYLDDVTITAADYTDSVISRDSVSSRTVISMTRCVINVPENANSCLENLAPDTRNFWAINNCAFYVPSGFTGFVILGPDFFINNTTFDAAAVTSGSYAMISCGSNNTAGKYLGRIQNCLFRDGGSSGSVFQLGSLTTATDFYESNNQFEGFTAPTSLTTSDSIYGVSHNAGDSYNCYLGSRIGRMIEITQSAGTAITTDIFESYETVYVNYTAAANININFQVADMVSGQRAVLVLLNNSGAQRDVVIECGASDFTINASTDGGAPSSAITLQPLDSEVCYVIAEYVHRGGGHPWILITTAIET